MTRSSFRPVMIAVAGVALAVALSGCGRKGPLDLPPNAQSRASVAPVAEEQDRGPGTVVDQTLREQEPPMPRGGKRKFILDPLLGD